MVIRLLYILLIFIIYPINLIYSQEFLTNSDYIYAEGRGRTLEEADKAALLALCNSIKSEIKTHIRYQVSSSDDIIRQRYTEDIQINSLVTIKDCGQYVEDFGITNFKVFRYINKKEYVESRLLKVNTLINESIKTFPYNVDINLKLGAYYYAYKILDDDLMDAFNYNNYEMKSLIKKNAIKLQKNIQFEEIPSVLYYVNLKKIPFVGEINHYTDKPYFDNENIYLSVNKVPSFKFNFEYWNGKFWSNKYERSFSNGDLNYASKFKLICTQKFPRNITVIKYRVTFETIGSDGQKIKINVPDDWYFVGNVYMAKRDRLEDWITYDLNRKVIDYNQYVRYKKYINELF